MPLTATNHLLLAGNSSYFSQVLFTSRSTCSSILSVVRSDRRGGRGYERVVERFNVEPFVPSCSRFSTLPYVVVKQDDTILVFVIATLCHQRQRRSVYVTSWEAQHA